MPGAFAVKKQKKKKILNFEWEYVNNWKSNKYKL